MSTFDTYIEGGLMPGTVSFVVQSVTSGPGPYETSVLSLPSEPLTVTIPEIGAPESVSVVSDYIGQITVSGNYPEIPTGDQVTYVIIEIWDEYGQFVARYEHPMLG